MSKVSLKGQRKIMSILSYVLISSILFGSGNLVVYAQEVESIIPNEVYEQQEKIGEISTLEDTAPAVVSEEEVLTEITQNEIEANIMERPYNGETEITASSKFSVTTIDDADNTDPNYAYIVSNDDVMQGVITTEGEYRWYAFTIDKKSKVSILLQTVEALDADLYMFLLNQESFSLDLIGGSATEGLGVYEFVNTVLEPGTYFFAVNGYEGIGNFAFAYYESSIDAAYEINDYSNVATEVALSANLVGVIDNPYDFDYYKFTVSKPTILRYSITNTKDYVLAYAGSTGSAPIIVDGNMIKVQPGTYYFAVYSPTETYDANSSYTVNFKKIGEYADESIVPLRAIHESSGIIFQTNLSGTKYYVNGNAIDISYTYQFSASNSGGSQNYNISLQSMDGMWCQIWNEEVQGPDVVYYHSSTRPYINIGSKNLLRLMFYTDTESPVKFYRINCRGTGAYAANTLIIDPAYVIVLIDPDTGKLVDIAEYNYFYDFAMGSNRITYSGSQSMTFNYSLYDYVN